jgi:glycosyltransferase involved in cell wall biosynthesis
MTKPIKVLFLSQWYPNRYDQMAGLFVRKHAEAVSLYCQVKVLYVHADETIQNFEIHEETHNNITELTVYYPAKSNNYLKKFKKTGNYFRAYQKGYKMITKDGFTPDIVHANILTRTGFIAYFLKKTKGIPYVISEHWSRYLKNRDSYKGILRKIITKIAVKNASAILPVSENLKKAMLAHHLNNSNYKIINNVVDNYFFEVKTIEVRTRKRILHVSCFDEAAKNIKGILNATFELSKKRQDFELIIIGTGIDFENVRNFAENLGFQNGIVHFLGEKTPQEVANWMQNSDFFVLFSNYETASVVIAESLISGIPIISTDVGIASQYINNSNGFLIPFNDEIVLLNKMNFMLDNFSKYDSKQIKLEAQNIFSYSEIGNTITEIYRQIIDNN